MSHFAITTVGVGCGDPAARGGIAWVAVFWRMILFNLFSLISRAKKQKTPNPASRGKVRYTHQILRAEK